jgi:hypothetical protein
LKVLLSALFFLFIHSSYAEEIRYYDVEIVVIENQSEQAKNAEYWPLEVNFSKPVNTITLGEQPLSEWLPIDVDLTQSFKVLSKNEFQLNAEVEKLSNSRTQRVLFHTAWRQPGLDKKVAMPVYFKHEVSDKALAATEAVTTTTDEPQSASPPAILEGMFKVTLARYLHLEAELSYRPKPVLVAATENSVSGVGDLNYPATGEIPGVIHFIQERSRIRSSELHYLDHPVLGVLLQITPYIKPAIIEEVTPKAKRQ